MYECFCNKYNIRHFYNPFTCEIVYYPSNEINNNFYSKRCKYFSDYNFCKNDYCHCKHLKDIELPVENDIADTLIERHTTESGEIGWKITKPSYDVKDVMKPSYDVKDVTKLSYDVKDPMKPSYDVKDVTKLSYDVKDPMTTSYDVKDPMKPSYDVKDVMTPSYDVKDVTKLSYNVKDPMKPSYDVKDVTKLSYDVKDVMTTSYDVKDPITLSYDVKDPITLSYDVKDVMKSTEPLYLSYDLQKQQEIPVYPLMDPTYPSYEPTYPSYEPTYPSYEPINKKLKLLPETTKVCCHYHNKYRPQKEMIKEHLNNKIIWICSENDECKIATIV
jgi:hypothetical protein